MTTRTRKTTAVRERIREALDERDWSVATFAERMQAWIPETNENTLKYRLSEGFDSAWTPGELAAAAMALDLAYEDLAGERDTELVLNAIGEKMRNRFMGHPENRGGEIFIEGDVQRRVVRFDFATEILHLMGRAEHAAVRIVKHIDKEDAEGISLREHLLKKIRDARSAAYMEIETNDLGEKV